MPLIQIKGISGILNDEKKKELIEKVTDAVVSVEGEGLRPVTWVLVDEVPMSNWAVGGKQVTADCIKKLAANTSAACAS
ncbi:MAG: 4-oxalocrotonate tautomerase family protein [Nitrospinota bacterium]